jgi:predicted nucleic acid-binding protein
VATSQGMIVFDTNVYIDAMCDVQRGRVLADIIETSQDTVAVSSVVVAELLVGLTTPARRGDLLAAIVGTVPVPERLMAPLHDDWHVAGDALRGLGGDAVTKRRSFWNDLLIAANCARTGTTLLTSNHDDFRRIRRVIPVKTLAVWE